MAALITPLSAVRRGGISIKVNDESLGTGDGSEASYDLKFDNILSTSYTVSYADASGTGTNAFTAFTETTDYALDGPSGRVLLTGTGVSTGSGKALYASYEYLSDITEAQIDQFITAVTKRLKELTGRYWTATTITEYHDGVSRSKYPRTNRPFEADKAEYDKLNLFEWPVRSVDEAYILDRTSTNFPECWSSDGGSFTDNTDEANTPGGTAFYPFAATPASNDAVYFGSSFKFLGAITRLQTLGTDSGALDVDWEYWDGDSWEALSWTAATTGADQFTASGKTTWSLPSAWAKTEVNSGGSLYFVRARVNGGGYTVSPKLWEAWADPDSILSEELSLREIDYTRYGLVRFLETTIPDGVRNIRMKYTCGVESTDDSYELGVDLANLLTALMVAVAVTGGSYDDETSFTLGPWATTIGEQYVNVAEVVKQLTNEINDVKRLIGDRINVV